MGDRMKHHKYAKGWREWNEMTHSEFIRDLILMTCSYAAAFVILAIVVRIWIR